MPNLTLQVKPNGKLHDMIMREVKFRVRLSHREWDDMRAQWRDNEDRVLAYLPEKEADRKRRHKREEEGEPKYTTIVVPYTYAILMSALTYWTSVFLSRTPIMQFEGNNAEAETQVLALEALIAYQLRTSGALPVLYSWFYDVGRYGVGWIGYFWDREEHNITEIIPGENEGEALQRTRSYVHYEGNRLYNMHPSDMLTDPRVPMRDFQKGEFLAARRKLSWMQVKTHERQGYYTNIDEIDKNIRPLFPDEDREESSQRTPEDELWFTGEDTRVEKNHPDIVPVYEVYIKLIPKDWDVGSQDFPEIWVCTVTADYKTILGFRPLGHLHSQFPFQNIEIEPDAYALANRGLPEIVEDTQSTMDWLINSHFYNVRASLNNLFIADPMKIYMKDLTDPLPGGIVRTKPAAAMGNLDNAIKQIPIQDITQQNINDLQLMMQIGERITGVTDQTMGVPRQGGRRSATEARQTAGFSVNRLKTTAEYMSYEGFDPLSRALVMNSQQFYTEKQTLRRVGNLATYGSSKYINVDPESIKGQFDFVPVDGTLPVDKLAIANLWREMFQTLQRMPGVAMQFDLSRIFSYVAQLMGLRNIDQFRFNVQVRPDQQLENEAQQGNMIPMRGNGASPETLPQSEDENIGPVAVG